MESRVRIRTCSVESQRRTAAAQSAGLFDEEIVAMDVTYQVTSKETGKTSQVSGRIVKDEGNRPETTYEALAKLKPVWARSSSLRRATPPARTAPRHWC
jgi:acetyl-CoA acetyltransferase